jgi:predicted O-methyltransferase YrrM
MDMTYWIRAGRSFLHHARTPGFLADVARSGLRADTEPKAPTRSIFDVYPAAEGKTVELGTIGYRISNVDPMEQFCLVAIARLRQPRTVFELGTYDGTTTMLLARNLPDACILTLDLDPALASIATVDGEIDNARSGVGSRFIGHPEAQRIEQLIGDSRSFDFSPWFGSIDLVIVDAGHEYESASADTATAFQLLRPGGVIVWDDYVTGWPGVVRAVDESGRKVFHLAGTDLAVYDEQAFS